MDLLQDALDRPQPARHGRGPTGLLTAVDIEALAVLDQHPALRVLSDYGNEQYWTRGSEADGIEFDRATEFVAMLTEAEIEARLGSVKSARGWPADEFDLQQCPVCGSDSLVATGSGGWGYGIVAATCQVCSYRQSEHASELENLDTEWEMRWKDR